MSTPKKMPATYWTVTAVALLLIAGGVLWALASSNTAAHATAPASATSNGGIPVGDGPVRVDIYEDFQCPACGTFETTYGNQIQQLVTSNKITAVYHPMSFLGPESERASAASGCAADAGLFDKFHQYLFAHQPAEHSGGYTTQDLVSVGQAIGAPDSYSQCVLNGTYAAWTAAVDQDAAQAGVTATPTFAINSQFVTGTALTLSDIMSAITGAANNPNPSPDPSEVSPVHGTPGRD